MPLGTSGIIAGAAYVLIEAVDKTGAVLAAVGNNLKALSRFNPNIQTLIRGLDALRLRLIDVGNEIRRFGGSLMSSGFRLLFTGGLLATPIRHGIREALTFQEAMNAVQAVLKETDEGIKDLEALIKQLGATTVFTASDIARAAETMVRGGFNKQQVKDSLEAVSNLARAGKVDLPTAADAMVAVINTFGLSAEQATTVADQFFEASRHGIATVQDLMSAMAFVGGTARSMKVSLADVLGILSVTSNAMLRGTRGGTNFNNMLTYMGAAADEVREKLGFEPFDETTGELKSMTEITILLANALKDMPAEKRITTLKDIFNIRGKRNVEAVVGLVDEVVAAIKDIKDSAGESAKATKIMNKEMVGSFYRIKSALNALAISFGHAFTKPMESIERWAVPLANFYRDWIENNEKVATTITKVIATVLALGVALIALGVAVKVVAFAFATLHLLNPWLLALYAGIAGLVYIFRDTFTEILGVGNEAYSEIVKLFAQGKIEEAMEATVKTTKILWRGFLDDFIAEFYQIMYALEIKAKGLQATFTKTVHTGILNLMSKTQGGIANVLEFLGATDLAKGFRETAAAAASAAVEGAITIDENSQRELNKLMEGLEALRKAQDNSREATRELIDVTIKNAKLSGDEKFFPPDKSQYPGFPFDEDTAGTGGKGALKFAPSKLIQGLEYGQAETRQKFYENRMIDYNKRTADGVERLLDITDTRLPVIDIGG